MNVRRLLAALALFLTLGVASAVPVQAAEPNDRWATATSIEEMVASADYIEQLDAPVLRLYQAFFNRPPDLGGAKYWLGIRRQGFDLLQIAGFMADGDEFANTYAGTSNPLYVELVYSNVLGRAFDQEGYDYWLGLLNEGAINRVELVFYVTQNLEFINSYPFLGPLSFIIFSDLGVHRVTGAESQQVVFESVSDVADDGDGGLLLQFPDDLTTIYHDTGGDTYQPVIFTSAGYELELVGSRLDGDALFVEYFLGTEPLRADRDARLFIGDKQSDGFTDLGLVGGFESGTFFSPTVGDLTAGIWFGEGFKGWSIFNSVGLVADSSTHPSRPICNFVEDIPNCIDAVAAGTDGTDLLLAGPRVLDAGDGTFTQSEFWISLVNLETGADQVVFSQAGQRSWGVESMFVQDGIIVVNRILADNTILPALLIEPASGETAEMPVAGFARPTR